MFPVHNPVETVDRSALGVNVDGDFLDRLREGWIGFHFLFRLFQRVEHGRMVAPTELAADIRRGERRHPPYKVHRGLTGVDDFAAAGAALDDLLVDAEVA